MELTDTDVIIELSSILVINELSFSCSNSFYECVFKIGDCFIRVYKRKIIFELGDTDLVLFVDEKSTRTICIKKEGKPIERSLLDSLVYFDNFPVEREGLIATFSMIRAFLLRNN